jgi:SAM-dependent methyltransferase
MSESKTASEHYDEKYFEWQRSIGLFGGWANSHKFLATVKPNDTVIDFGCGGGYLLANLKCGWRIGIEPNDSAGKEAKRNGVLRFASPAAALAELGEHVADVIISNHALEHTLNPLEEIKSLKRLLKPGGAIHFFVPCDSVDYLYDHRDINYHLFSWSPQNLGNLFHEAGYKIVYAKSYKHKWPPLYRYFAKLGWPIFNLLCKVYGRINRNWVQVEVRAINEIA